MNKSVRAKLLEHLAERGLSSHSEVSRIPLHQVVPLGGNPLPIRVAIEALAPTHVLCVTTAATGAETQARLRRWAESEGIKWFVAGVGRAGHELDVEAALDDARCQHAWLRGEVPVGLHYTGGTKAMVAGARLWWSRHFDSDPERSQRHQCTYLDTAEGMVFQHPAGACAVREIALDLETMTGLHNVELGRSEPDPASDALAVEIGDGLFSPGRSLEDFIAALPPIHGIKVDLVFVPQAAPFVTVKGAGQSVPFVGNPGTSLRLEHAASAGKETNLGPKGALSDYPLDALAVACGVPRLHGYTPNSLLPTVSRRNRLKWLSGGWFEAWLFARLQRTKPGWDECLCNFLLFRPSEGSADAPEIDIALRRGHEVVLTSVTTGTKVGHTREKAHMARTQAAALGGDHCRYLMASWIPDEPTLVRVAREQAQHWQGPDRFRLLGYDHYLGRSAVTHVRGDVPVKETLDEMLQNWFR